MELLDVESCHNEVEPTVPCRCNAMVDTLIYLGGGGRAMIRWLLADGLAKLFSGRAAQLSSQTEVGEEGGGSFSNDKDKTYRSLQNVIF